MDLKRLDTVSASNEGAELAIYAPDGEKTDIVIRLAGVDSDVYRKASRKQRDKRLQNLQKRGKQKLTSAELDEEGIALLAACTLGWENLEENGQPLECTRENAERLYHDYPDVRQQVDAFIGDRANFLAQ